MSDTNTPATVASLATTGSGGCCAGPASAVTAVDVQQVAPCCGTTAEAVVAEACCAPAAKTEAVAAGAGCCG